MKGSRKSPLEEATLIKAFNEFEKSSKNLLRGPEAYPLLEIVSGPKQGAWFTLTHQKEISLGRANVNSIVLEDNSVSRSHSVIHEVDGKYFIKDVGSRNGTYVNDKKIQEDFLLKQGDRIKVGIYVLRFLSEPGEEAVVEEEPVEEATVMEGEEQVLASPAQAEAGISPEEVDTGVRGVAEEKTRREKIAMVSQAAVEEPTPQEEKAAPAPKKEKRVLKNLTYLLVALILMGGIGYTVYRFYIRKRINLVQKVTPPVAPNVTPPIQVQPPATPPAPMELPPTAPPTAPVAVQPFQPPAPTAPQGPTVPIFLDVDAKPMPAKIYFQGKELGATPFKVNVAVVLGTPQELTAVYHFDELGQDFTEKKSFTVSKQDEVVNVRFEGGVGTFHVKGLPKDTQVYLEGTFALNQMKTQAVKLNDIVYTRPIYLPFGNYALEIKKPERLEGSETVVDVVKYRRAFVLSKESSSIDLSLADQDLTVFPAKIKTTPEGAEVLVDGKKFGQTPFDGNLPLGKHMLVLKKEGFYDHEQPLTMTMNTPFLSEVSLKTSEAGQFINKGRELMRQGQYQLAVDQLAESLNHNPSSAEISQVQLLLGQSYVKTGANDVAIGYFEKAKANPPYKGQADLGIAEANLNANNKDAALAKVIDVMLNEKDEKIKSDAEGLFHKISPLKSVILVSTDPPGAKVTINGQEISQPSPVVLSDLGLGSYRVTIQKDGFKPFESRFQMAVSTFKPVVLKLQPLQ